MKRSLYFIIPAVFAFNITNVSALEIDEKLTLRFLKVSSTKKTVLINRGGEDGLVVGDHAKFFITAGVVARGVSEKVSPSRSVWSLYRIVDPAEIEQDKVLNLKIASPVKITDDPSKSLKEEVIPGGSETMNVEPGTAGEEVMSAEDKDELKDLGINEDGEEPAPVASTKKTNSKKSAPAKSVSVAESSPVGSTNYSKTWEVWGTMYFNSLSGTYESDEETTTTTSTSASSSSVDFSIGAEKYFMNFDNFLKEVSLNAFIHKRSVESGDAVQSKTDWLEYGGGISYHFYNSASSINRLVGYGTLSGGIGKGSVETTSEVSGTTDEVAPEGTSTFFSVGLGAKYVLNNGFGFRAILDYYSTSESYEYEAFTVTRSLSGPRINVGLSYRF